MKKILVLSTLMMFSLVGCGGDKNKSNSNGYFTNSYSTQEGFYNLQTRSLTVNGQVVMPADQQSIAIVNNALQAAQYSVQPIMSNNMYGYRARITAQIYSPYGYNTGYGQGGYNTGYNSGYNSGYPNNSQQTVTISGIQFY